MITKKLFMAGVCWLAAMSAARAEDTSSFKWQGEVRSAYLREENRDFGGQSIDPSDVFTLDSRLRMSYSPRRDLFTFFEGSAVKTWGEASSNEDDTGRNRTEGEFLELRQLYARFDEIGDIIPLNIQIGRQRIYEPYGFWWNRDLDAIRVNYNSTLFNGFLAVSENQGSYRTNDDQDEDEQNRFRIMAEASRLITPTDRLEFRALYEKDHSGRDEIGETFDRFDYDDEDNNLVWTGLRSAGSGKMASSGFHNFRYRLDGVVVAGSADDTRVASFGSTDTRTITGYDKSDVLGFAFDGEANFFIDGPKSPMLTLGYAYGSGDNDETDGNNHSFRQSDIQGNLNRFALSSTPIHHYGEVFRPELSNMHILTGGLSFPILNSSDLNLLYHSYWLDEEEGDIRSSRINADFDGSGKHLGQEADLVWNLKLHDELPIFSKLSDQALLRTSVGAFKAGEAFAPNDSDEYAFRGLVEFRLKF